MDLKLFLKIRENALKRTRVSTETSRLGRFFFFLSFPIVGYFFRFFFLFFSFRFLAPSVFFFLPSRNNPGGVLRFDFFFSLLLLLFFFPYFFLFSFFFVGELGGTGRSRENICLSLRSIVLVPLYVKSKVT